MGNWESVNCKGVVKGSVPSFVVFYPVRFASLRLCVFALKQIKVYPVIRVFTPFYGATIGNLVTYIVKRKSANAI